MTENCDTVSATNKGKWSNILISSEYLRALQILFHNKFFEVNYKEVNWNSGKKSLKSQTESQVNKKDKLRIKDKFLILWVDSWLIWLHKEKR